MKTAKEIKEWLLENCVNEKGDLILTGLDFSDFDNDIYIDSWKVKADLRQNRHIVGGNLFQEFQEVQGNLFQEFQEVQGNLFQNYHEVKGDLYQNEQKFGGTLFAQNTTYLKRLADRGWCITYKGNKK